MIEMGTIATAMYEAMKLAATRLPPDVEQALCKALAEETEQLAIAHLQSCLENAAAAKSGRGLVCGDTGFPLFYAKIGPGVEVEGGMPAIWRAARSATEKATLGSLLRPTMVDPLTRQNPGNNIGPGMPKVEIIYTGKKQQFEIMAVPKGGGSEIFGTFYRMLFPADGKAGIKKFVIECIKDSCYAGKICPPAIIGVGLGGTADLCMKLAKEAALLRVVGEHHSDPETAQLETELLDAARQLGIGPMGSRGINCVLGVHIDKAVTHTAALPVAFNAQCLVGRRWQAMIAPDGRISYSGDVSNWKKGI